MRRVVACAVMVLACLCVPARPAHAQRTFLEWLERLSGPGPFKVGMVHVPFSCYGFEKESSTAPDPVLTDPKAKSDAVAAQHWFLQPGCGKSARNLVRVTIGAQIAKGSGDNNLLYDDSVPDDERDHVNVQVFLGTVDFGLHNSVELGIGAGFIRFSDLPIDSFTRLAVQPARVIWKPLAMFASKGGNLYQREALQVWFTASWFPGGFTAEDFGAIPGTFDSGKEIQGSFAIGVDLLALFKINAPSK